MNFKNSRAFRLTAVFCFSVIFLSCERKMDESTKLQIQLPYTSANQMSGKAEISAQSIVGGGQWGVSDPTAFNDISCFAIAVEAPDLNQFRCTRSDGSIALRPGVLVGAFRAGEKIEVDVPAGPDRRIHAIGFAATSLSACTNFDLNDGPDKTNLSAPHLLGSIKRDLDPGNATVLIAASLSSAGKFSHCDKPNFGDEPVGGTSNLSVSDATTTEGATLNFDFVLDSPAGSNVVVNFNVASGTAIASGTDFLEAPGGYAVTIPLGATISTFSIGTVQDSSDEDSETMSVSISSAAFVTVADGFAVGTILDDDAAPLIFVDDFVVTEGGSVVFAASLSAYSGKIVSFTWMTFDQTAVGGGTDYFGGSNVVSLSPGAFVTAITISTTDDGAVEAAETFMISLSSLMNVSVGDDVGIGTINDNDTLTISISDASGSEGQTLNFLVTLSQVAGSDVTFEYYTSNSTAVSPADFNGVSIPVTVTIGTGSAHTYLSVPTVDDGGAESTESFDVHLQSLSGASAGDIVGLGTILDNDAGVSLYVLDTSVTEGGTAAVYFSLSAVSGSNVDIGFNTYDSSAVGSGTDYNGGSFSVQIPAGQTFATFDITTVDDGLSEAAEVFLVSIATASNATISVPGADDSAVVTILDNDLTPGMWMGTPISVNEGQSANISINLDMPSASNVTVNLSTGDGTAVSGSGDYVSYAATTTLSAGVTIAFVPITVNSDGLDEFDEFFNVSLSSLGGASLIGSGFAAISIMDNDPEPSLSIQDSTHLEGQTLNFMVSLSQISGRDVSFNVATVDGTATQVSLSDYVGNSFSVTILAGGWTANFEVATTDDTLFEPVEDFRVTLTSLLNANPSLSSTGAKGIIRDNDGWGVHAKIVAPNADATDKVGHQVAVDGNLIVTTAIFEDSNQTTITQGSGSSVDNSTSSAGAAYVYKIIGGSLQQTAYLKADNPEINDNFGSSVDVDGNLVVIAAQGEDSSQSAVTANGSGDNAASNAGAVYVFRDNGGTWVQEAYLKPSHMDANDVFGSAVAASADKIVVGSKGESSNLTVITHGPTSGSLDNSAASSGAVYTFQFQGGSWVQGAMIKASNAGSSDGFGSSVDLFGGLLVVGAENEASNQTFVTNGAGASSDNSSTGSGAAYVYRLGAGGSWQQEAYLKASNAGASDKFGYKVAVFEGLVAVSAIQESSSQNFVTNGGSASGDDSMSTSGAVYVFEESGGSWSQQAYLKAAGAGTGDKFGSSLDVTYNTVVVGANLEDSGAAGIDYGPYAATDDSSTSSGAVYVFSKMGGSWQQANYIKAPVNTTGDQFGSDVAIDGDFLVVGALADDTGATDAGATYFYNWRGPVTAFVARDPSQASVTASHPMNFHVRFSRPINPGTFTTGDIVNSGTATGLTWNIINSGDNMNFTVQATAGSTGTGETYLPSVPSNSVQDNEGMGNDASLSFAPSQVTAP